jgi:hypothetical protein
VRWGARSCGDHIAQACATPAGAEHHALLFGELHQGHPQSLRQENLSLAAPLFPCFCCAVLLLLFLMLCCSQSCCSVLGVSSWANLCPVVTPVIACLASWACSYRPSAVCFCFCQLVKHCRSFGSPGSLLPTKPTLRSL